MVEKKIRCLGGEKERPLRKKYPRIGAAMVVRVLNPKEKKRMNSLLKKKDSKRKRKEKLPRPRKRILQWKVGGSSKGPQKKDSRSKRKKSLWRMLMQAGTPCLDAYPKRVREERLEEAKEKKLSIPRDQGGPPSLKRRGSD